VALRNSIPERIFLTLSLRGSEATEAISCINSFEIATPRQGGARNDKGLPQNLVTHLGKQSGTKALTDVLNMVFKEVHKVFETY